MAPVSPGQQPPGTGEQLADRDEQWAVLSGLAERARTGRGQLALVAGPVAAGKTALLDLFGEHLAARGFTWWRATGARAEQSLRYGVLGQLLGPDRVPAPGTGADQTSRMATVHDGCRAVLSHAATGPLLITVDDVQHIDEPSLEWLLACLRRIPEAAVLVVLTETTGPRPGTGPLHAELPRHRHCSRLSVGLLGADTVRRMVGGAPDAYRLTGGNPLLVTALRDDGGTAGTHYRQALTGLLHRCEPGVRRTAQRTAVLGTALPDSDATTVLTAAGLLHDGVFRHPQTSVAVLSGVSPDERSELYAWAARSRHDQGADAEEVASSLAGAGRADEPWATAVLTEAAEQAVQRERPADAVRYLELARTSADGAARTAIDAALARLERRVRPAAAVRRLPALSHAAEAGELTGPDLAALVRDLLWYGRDAATLLDRLRSSGADPALELWLAATFPAIPANPATSTRGALPQAAPAPPTAPLERSAAALLAVLGRGQASRAVADAELILQAGRPSDGYRWGTEAAWNALLALVYADRLDTAAEWCATLLSSPAGDVAAALVTAVRAEIALRRSALADAWRDATAALDLVAPAGWGVAAGLPLATAVTAATRLGRHDDAAGLLAQPMPDAMLQSRYGLHYLHARGEHYLATGRDYAALADFLSCGRLAADWGMDVPGLVAWRTSAADAWLRRRENQAEARRLLNEQLAKVGPDASRGRGVALRLLAATSQAQSRPQLLTEAVAILKGCGDRFELARALADLSRAYRAVGQPRRASPMARLAAEVAGECGAVVLYDEVLPLRTSVTVADEQDPRARLASLTESEMRVAALAAAGLTNREIAAKLFITTSTIEQHLTRIYRKLQVRHRRELPADLHTHLPLAA